MEIFVCSVLIIIMFLKLVPFIGMLNGKVILWISQIRYYSLNTIFNLINDLNLELRSQNPYFYIFLSSRVSGWPNNLQACYCHHYNIIICTCKLKPYHGSVGYSANFSHIFSTLFLTYIPGTCMIYTEFSRG